MLRNIDIDIEYVLLFFNIKKLKLKLFNIILAKKYFIYYIKNKIYRLLLILNK